MKVASRVAEERKSCVSRTELLFMASLIAKVSFMIFFSISRFVTSCLRKKSGLGFVSRALEGFAGG